MKHLSILLFLLSTLPVFSQEDHAYVGVGLGWNVTPYQNLNRMVEHYNHTRPWLDQEMKPFNGMFTKSFVLGGYFGPMGAEFRYVHRRAIHEANGISPNTGLEAWRKLKVKNHTFSAGYMVRIPGANYTALSIGASGDFGGFKVSTQSSDNTSWRKLTRGLGIQGGCTVFAHVWLGRAVAIKPYYQWVLSRINLEEVYFGLNPQTAGFGAGGDDFNSGYFTFHEHMHNYGIELIINFNYE